MKKRITPALVSGLIIASLLVSSCAPALKTTSPLTAQLSAADPASESESSATPSTTTATEQQTQYRKEYPTVILGKQNWLFWGNPINELIQSGGLDDTQIEQIVDELSYISSSLKEQGVDFLFILTPDKRLIYPEFMPKTYKEEDIPSSYDRLSEALSKSGIGFIDCKPLLLDKKTETGYPLYYLRDRRWNSMGNFLMVQEIINYLGEKYPVPQFELLSVDTSESRVCTDEIGNDLNDLIQSLSPWQEKGAPEPVYNVYPEPEAPSILWYGSCFSPRLINMMQQGWSNPITYCSLWGEYGFPLSLRQDISRRLQGQKVVIFEVNEHYRQKLSRMLVLEPPKVDLTMSPQRYSWQADTILQNWEPAGKYDIEVENGALLLSVDDSDLNPTFHNTKSLLLDSSRRYYLEIKIVSPAFTGILVDFSRTSGDNYYWEERQGQHIYEGDNTIIFEIPDENNFGPVKNIRIHVGDKAGVYSILQIAIYSKPR